MNKPNANWRLFRLLSEIYGRKTAYKYRNRLGKIVSNRPITPRAHKSSERDVILISYPDNLRDTGRRPLEVLDDFSSRHLKGLVNTVHLLPHYPYTSDDGFAVSDYLSVNPDFGTWEDVHKMTEHFSLMFDGVFNHVSSSHKWFQGFLDDDPKYRNYFISLDKLTDVSMVTRPRTSPLLVAFDTKAGEKYVWATFSADQLDLNYANPEVLLEIVSTMLEYVRHGADFIRLDAMGFIWKDLGTNCIHHPRAHAIIRLLHEVLNQAAPWVWLVSETNVPHHENITYFGNGRNEAQMVYNFALPPLVVHTLQAGDATALTNWAATLETPSNKTMFFNFTASHDGIGVRGAAGLLSSQEVTTMYKRVKQRGGALSMRTGADGKESVYEMNISYFNAVADPSVSSDMQLDQFMCSQAIALSIAGVPGIYLHSLLGSTNWEAGIKKVGYNRAINREKLDVKLVEKELADDSSLRSRVMTRYEQMLRIRSRESAFSPQARQKVKDFGPKVFAVRRTSKLGTSRVLALHNVTSDTIEIELKKSYRDLLTGEEANHHISLAPYQVAWLKPKRSKLRHGASVEHEPQA